MRACNEHEITIEQLINVVHNYTDPIRIRVIMGNAWLTCEEARHMQDFYLTERYSYTDVAEEKRLLKYYKDVPVWNLAVWMDCNLYSKEGRAIYTGIEAHCHYKDIREGYLAEQADKKREKRREYYKRKKMQEETDAMMENA